MRGCPPFKGEGGSVGKHRRGGSKRENARHRVLYIVETRVDRKALELR
jgi:hypothetical protein